MGKYQFAALDEFRREEKVFLLRLYAKSEKEELNLKEKIKLRQIVQAIKGTDS